MRLVVSVLLGSLAVGFASCAATPSTPPPSVSGSAAVVDGVLTVEVSWKPSHPSLLVLEFASGERGDIPALTNEPPVLRSTSLMRRVDESGAATLDFSIDQLRKSGDEFDHVNLFLVDVVGVSHLSGNPHVRGGLKTVRVVRVTPDDTPPSFVRLTSAVALEPFPELDTERGETVTSIRLHLDAANKPIAEHRVSIPQLK